MQRSIESGPNIRSVVGCFVSFCFASAMNCNYFHFYYSDERCLQQLRAVPLFHNGYEFISEKLEIETKNAQPTSLAHVWEIYTRNSCSSARKRCNSGARLQYCHDGGLIRHEHLFRRNPFFHLSCCHPAPFTCAPAKCINQATFTFRLQLCKSSKTSIRGKQAIFMRLARRATHHCIEKFWAVIESLW